MPPCLNWALSINTLSVSLKFVFAGKKTQKGQAECAARLKLKFGIIFEWHSETFQGCERNAVSPRPRVRGRRQGLIGNETVYLVFGK